jgi:hypothetical protein
MALSSALFTGLTGLNAQSARLDVIGNNIANVNTTAFKSSRMMFESLFSQNLGFGTSPSEIRGGVNPKQIGKVLASRASSGTFRPRASPAPAISATSRSMGPASSWSSGAARASTPAPGRSARTRTTTSPP